MPTRLDEALAAQIAVPAPNRLWRGDITYVATHEGWLYLVVLLDAHSRRVVGWALVGHLRAELALDAPATALQARRSSADSSTTPWLPVVCRCVPGGPRRAARASITRWPRAASRP